MSRGRRWLAAGIAAGIINGCAFSVPTVYILVLPGLVLFGFFAWATGSQTFWNRSTAQLGVFAFSFVFWSLLVYAVFARLNRAAIRRQGQA